MENILKCQKCKYFNPVVVDGIELPCEKCENCKIEKDGIPQFTVKVISIEPFQIEMYPNPNPFKKKGTK